MASENRNNEYQSSKKLNSSEDVYKAVPTSDVDDSVLESFRYRTFACPHCRTLLSATKKDVGSTVVCPDCECEVAVPNYLDFDTPTDYERQYFDKKKRERDKMLSPLTNPNRVGLDMEADDVYAVRDDHQGKAKPDARVYLPVRCRICETLMHATVDMLGKEIACPDCGAKTIVTDALKKQQDSLDVKFQPKNRGVYEIGEVPVAPMIAFQRSNGQTAMIDPNDKRTGPDPKLYPAEKYRPPRKRDSYNDLSFERTEASYRPKKGRFEQWLERRAKRREERLNEAEDFVKFLPPMVLRPKNGQLVWSLPSPPKPAPLFNKTFQAVRSEEIWSRMGIVVICLIAMVTVSHFVVKPSRILAVPLAGQIGGAIAEMELLFSSVFLLIMSTVTCSFLGLYFWSVYNAGNSGARKVVEWRSEDLGGFFGYGFWFLAFMVVSFLPGTLVASVFNKLAGVDLEDFVATAFPSIAELFSILGFTICFWFFFPIFWISTHQTDLPFCPITWRVFTSFISKFHLWLELYLFSAVFCFVPSFAVLALRNTTAIVFLAPTVIPLLAMFYGLILGRFSWILDDEVRLMDFDDVDD